MDAFIYFLLGILLGAFFTLIFCLLFFNRLKNTVNSNAITDLNNILSPFREALQHMNQKVSDLELKREGAYSGLKEQIDSLIRSQFDLNKETNHLRSALTSPSIRGRWGEMQLRRCVELSGMSPYCDFLEQQSIKSDDELLRPDLIITLPKNKKVVVDAKAPIEAYGNDSKEEISTLFRRHISGLKKKSYFKALEESPEFVVMFIPAEGLLAKALLADPLLIDFAAQMDVILATPSTLIAILKSVAFSLRQDMMASNIEEVRKLARELIDRTAKMADHFDKLGKHLKMATETYNQTLTSLDSRVLVTARKIAQIKGDNIE